MTTRMTINGVSTCAGSRYGEIRAFPIGYENPGGPLGITPIPHRQRLFSCVKPTWTVPAARQVAERKEGKGGQTMNDLSNPDRQVQRTYHGLDGIFDDTGAWGTDTLKGWIDITKAHVSPPPTAIRQSSRASTIWNV